VKLTLEQIAAWALTTLSEAERRRSVVYIEARRRPAGESIPLGRRVVTRAAPTVVVFVDLEPAANWSHPCRYLLIDPDSDARESIEGEFPPPRDHLRLVHRGSDVADWMLLTTVPLGTDDTGELS